MFAEQVVMAAATGQHTAAQKHASNMTDSTLVTTKVSLLPLTRCHLEAKKSINVFSLPAFVHLFICFTRKHTMQWKTRIRIQQYKLRNNPALLLDLLP